MYVFYVHQRAAFLPPKCILVQSRFRDSNVTALIIAFLAAFRHLARLRLFPRPDFFQISAWGAWVDDDSQLFAVLEKVILVPFEHRGEFRLADCGCFEFCSVPCILSVQNLPPYSHCLLPKGVVRQKPQLGQRFPSFFVMIFGDNFQILSNAVNERLYPVFQMFPRLGGDFILKLKPTTSADQRLSQSTLYPSCSFVRRISKNFSEIRELSKRLQVIDSSQLLLQKSIWKYTSMAVFFSRVLSLSSS